jgi:superfamily II DNA or RNA helicase/HKD family nuclease
MSLPDGLYDLLLTETLLGTLSKAGGEQTHTIEALTAEDAPERLASALASELVRVLDDLENEGAEKLRQQLDLVNSILVNLRSRLQARSDKTDLFPSPPQLLRAIHTRSAASPTRPETGLLAPWLFTAGKGSPSLLTELRRELSACDHVDILVSFITHSGVRKLLDILQSATAVGANGEPRTRIRVLTTTYTGATEIRALDELARLPGCEIRISLDGRRTRLHAKAWLFRRRTGFGAAYVGSANLSGAALMGGLEWTVKFTQRGQTELFERACAHFETLWEDSEFQPYDPDNQVHRIALGEALKRESGEDIFARPTYFDLEPKAYQQDMLDQLQTERDHGRWRNLIVAATGTGKTVVAAFDYKRLCLKEGGRPRLLFVAHREEILKQAQRTYREVLRDHSFGELCVGGAELQGFDHVFATIDSVISRNLMERCGSAHWYVVVVDECHRLAGARFEAFVMTVQPRLLLGLTATPERSDGKPILPYFDNRPDGSPAVELRLWHALEQQLLTPFEYYACDDETDFSEVPWQQPGELAAIDKLVTGNDIRARQVLNEWQRLAGDPTRSRALVFCVSVAHAQYMTEKINEYGIKALCVVGDTPNDERRNAPEKLAQGKVAALVTCDLYNEGIDLPLVDTLLLLRPTQSPVLFQQQIGRGLRLAKNKDSCLILDFVGRHRARFRFDRLLSTITGLSRAQLIEAVEKGFGALPAGCHIQLQHQAREQVLRSLRTLIQQNWRQLRTELQAFSALKGRESVRLSAFLREQAIELEEIYRGSGRSGWTQLKRDAGLLATPIQSEEDYFARRFGDLLHIDDPDRLNLLLQMGPPKTCEEPKNDRQNPLLLQMLAYQIDAQHHQTETGEAFLNRLQTHPDFCSEMVEIGEVLQSKSTLLKRPIPGLEETPLCLHAAYGIREILTAVGWLDATRRTPFQAGVLPLKDQKIELLFVTLDKRDGYHEKIAYHDYAISPDRFHWQSQNAASPESMAGRRYLESPQNGWRFQLFVRHAKGAPYRACGPVSLESAEGRKPMSIHWRLSIPLPIRLFQEFSILRGA